jgi:hypothetical protein
MYRGFFATFLALTGSAHAGFLRFACSQLVIERLDP